jgi:hypothetical protein
VLPLLLAPVLAIRLPGSEPGANLLRGRLAAGPALQTPDGKRILLTGDPATLGVLKDARLKGAEFEVSGHMSGPDQFTIDPIHTRSLFAYKDGKRLMVTYWCDVCSIRTYTPGKCWCCQEETQLDLIAPDKVDRK